MGHLSNGFHWKKKTEKITFKKSLFTTWKLTLFGESPIYSPNRNWLLPHLVCTFGYSVPLGTLPSPSIGFNVMAFSGTRPMKLHWSGHWNFKMLCIPPLWVRIGLNYILVLWDTSAMDFMKKKPEQIIFKKSLFATWRVWSPEPPPVILKWGVLARCKFLKIFGPTLGTRGRIPHIRFSVV